VGGGRGDPQAAVVHPPHGRRHRPPEPAPAGGDQHQAAVGDQRQQPLQLVGIGPVVEEVVDRPRCDPGRIDDYGADGRRSGPRRGVQAATARGEVDPGQVARAGHQHRPARPQGAALGRAERVLHARPGFDQRQLARRRLLRRWEQMAVAVGGEAEPFVEQDVLLQPALEVVAEGAVGVGRGQAPEVRLHHVPAADDRAGHGAADGDHPEHHLVPRHGRQASRHIRGDALERPVAEDRALAHMPVELVAQLHIREAQPDALHPAQDLRVAGHRDRLVPHQTRPVGAGEVNGGVGQRSHGVHLWGARGWGANPGRRSRGLRGFQEPSGNRGPGTGTGDRGHGGNLVETASATLRS
jgi:hypothetical protein